jgi:hypothetical protein
MITEKEYQKALQTIDGYVTQLRLSHVMPRYFVDERGGCAAVRDNHHKGYDAEYNGLHQDTPDVVIYKHGHNSKDGWMMKPEDINFLNAQCERLNAEYEA